MSTEPEQPPERDASVSDYAAGPFRRLIAALIDDSFLLRKDRRSVTDLVTGSVIVYVPSE